jgi:hypothetical protein
MKPKQIKRVTKYCLPGVTLANKGDYWQIRKIGITGDRVKKDPVFARTRAQAAKFTHAIEWARKINNTVLEDTGLKKSPGRLAGILVKTMPPGFQEADSVFTGLMENGDALVGFEFNENAQWKDMQHVQYRSTYNLRHCRWKFHLQLHKPASSFKPPEGITHYRIVASAITINKEGKMVLTEGKRLTLLPLKAIQRQPLCLEVEAVVDQDQVCFALLHMQWYRRLPNNDQIMPASIPGAITITAMYKH